MNARKKLKPNGAVRTLRKIMGLTQAELAKAFGISTAYVQAVELGHRQANIRFAERLALMSGASANCIAEHAEVALTNDGRVYTKEYFLEEGSKMKFIIDGDLSHYTKPFRYLFLAAVQRGILPQLANSLKKLTENLAAELDLTRTVEALVSPNSSPVYRIDGKTIKDKEELFTRFAGLTPEHIAALPDDAILTLHVEHEEPPEPWFDPKYFGK